MTARYTLGILAVAGLLTGAPLLHAQSAPLQILNDSLPAAVVGAAYNVQLFTAGGLCKPNGTPSSTIDVGALPAGLSINSPALTKQWFLQGTPSVAGDYSFIVHLIWTYNRVNPVDQSCTDNASKVFTLTVQSSNPPPPPPPTNQTLAANPQQISTTYHIGTFPPAADAVQVTSSGVAAPITLQAATDSGGPWLSVTPQSATTPTPPISISYAIGGLTQGTYTGHITVSLTGTQVTLTIPVTLQVIADSVQLLASPKSLVFLAAVGGPDPPAQSINVTVAGLNRLFQAVVSAPPNGKWLTVTPSAALTPATLSVAVTTKDLPAATYNGTLTLAVSGFPNGSVTIPVTFTIQVPAQRPTIAAGGVVDAAGGRPAIAPGTWVSLFGTAFSATNRPWRDTDFLNGRLPTSLDGVSVTINGKSAAVAFISSTQINVLATDDIITGLVPVVVKNGVGSSDSVLALQQTAAPALFEFPGGKYAAAVHADGSFIASPALVQAQGLKGGTPAHVGETIVLFGTGFGVTKPPISATVLVTTPLPLANPEEFALRIGGVDAVIAYAGLISPGLYQFNVVVPQVAAGDQPVVAELRGLLSQSPLLLTIQ
jgi:uncharacterized protein (TIGR03437 family)